MSKKRNLNKHVRLVDVFHTETCAPRAFNWIACLSTVNYWKQTSIESYSDSFERTARSECWPAYIVFMYTMYIYIFKGLCKVPRWIGELQINNLLPFSSSSNLKFDYYSHNTLKWPSGMFNEFLILVCEFFFSEVLRYVILESRKKISWQRWPGKNGRWQRPKEKNRKKYNRKSNFSTTTNVFVRNIFVRLLNLIFELILSESWV